MIPFPHRWVVKTPKQLWKSVDRPCRPTLSDLANASTCIDWLLDATRLRRGREDAQALVLEGRNVWKDRIGHGIWYGFSDSFIFFLCEDVAEILVSAPAKDVADVSDPSGAGPTLFFPLVNLSFRVHPLCAIWSPFHSLFIVQYHSLSLSLWFICLLAANRYMLLLAVTLSNAFAKSAEMVASCPCVLVSWGTSRKPKNASKDQASESVSSFQNLQFAFPKYPTSSSPMSPMSMQCLSLGPRSSALCQELRRKAVS